MTAAGTRRGFPPEHLYSAWAAASEVRVTVAMAEPTNAALQTPSVAALSMPRRLEVEIPRDPRPTGFRTGRQQRVQQGAPAVAPAVAEQEAVSGERIGTELSVSIHIVLEAGGRRRRGRLAPSSASCHYHPPIMVGCSRQLSRTAAVVTGAAAIAEPLGGRLLGAEAAVLGRGRRQTDRNEGNSRRFRGPGSLQRTAAAR